MWRVLFIQPPYNRNLAMRSFNMKKSSQALFLTLIMVASTTPSYSTGSSASDAPRGVVARCKSAIADTVQSANQAINNMSPSKKAFAVAGF